MDCAPLSIHTSFQMLLTWGVGTITTHCLKFQILPPSAGRFLYETRSLRDEVSTESHRNHVQMKPTIFVPMDKPSLDANLNLPGQQFTHNTSPSLTNPSPKTQDETSVKYNRPGTMNAGQDNKSSEIKSGWFDIIQDDEDSESCCSSTGVGDGYDCSGEYQPPQPLELDSFAYDFFIKGVMGFLCEILEGGGRWGGRNVRSTTWRWAARRRCGCEHSRYWPSGSPAPSKHATTRFNSVNSDSCFPTGIQSLYLADSRFHTAWV